MVETAPETLRCGSWKSASLSACLPTNGCVVVGRNVARLVQLNSAAPPTDDLDRVLNLSLCLHVGFGGKSDPLFALIGQGMY